MIQLEQAIDWDLISKTEVKYLQFEEQDIIIDIRNKQYGAFEEMK